MYVLRALPPIGLLQCDRSQAVPIKPRSTHAAVFAAYGWPADIEDEDILERLLALNLLRSTLPQENDA